MVDGARSTASPGVPALRPEIILEFEFDNGALHISLANIGARTARDVHTELSPAIRGLGGRQAMAELAVFRGITFFPQESKSGFCWIPQPRILAATSLCAWPRTSAMPRSGQPF